MTTRQQRRRIDRQIVKIMKTDGDRCSICHAPFQHSSATYGGTTADGTAAVVGDCCVKNLDQICGFGFYLAKRELDTISKKAGVTVNSIDYAPHPWKDDDAKWFTENPSRSHRIRPSYPDEPSGRDATPEGTTAFVLVRQIEPGTRAKLPLAIHHSLLPLPNSDALLRAIFDSCTQTPLTNNWTMVSREKIKELALQYADADQHSAH